MLKGKNAVVTGANRGIGREVVKRLVASGCNVWACARSENDDFVSFITALDLENEAWIKPIYFDLENDDEIKHALKGILREKKSIDILVNVAGIGHMGLFEMSPMIQIKTIYQVNVFAPMLITQLVMKRMAIQKSGDIINVTSTAAFETYPGNSVYGASKAALCQFTKSAAAETINRGIRINAIAPGLTSTDMSAIFEGNNPNLPLMRSAIGRKLEPVEVADAIISLLSDGMRMVNGQVICVNGGAS